MRSQRVSVCMEDVKRLWILWKWQQAPIPSPFSHPTVFLKSIPLVALWRTNKPKGRDSRTSCFGTRILDQCYLTNRRKRCFPGCQWIRSSFFLIVCKTQLCFVWPGRKQFPAAVLMKIKDGLKFCDWSNCLFTYLQKITETLWNWNITFSLVMLVSLFVCSCKFSLPNYVNYPRQISFTCHLPSVYCWQNVLTPSVCQTLWGVVPPPKWSPPPKWPPIATEMTPIRNRNDPVINFRNLGLNGLGTLLSILNSSFIHANTILNRGK